MRPVVTPVFGEKEENEACCNLLLWEKRENEARVNLRLWEKQEELGPF